MAVKIKVLGKIYTVKESVKNIKRTFLMQKTFFKLNEESKNQTDDDHTEKMIDANLGGIDKMVSYVLGIVPDKKLTEDHLAESLTFDELGELVQDIISKLLHVEEQEEEEKKAGEPESE